MGVSNLCENHLLRGPLSHVWVSILFFFLLLLFLLFRIFVVAFVSAPASASICSFFFSLSLSLFFSISLSLSLTTTSRGLCISLYLLCASPLECLCNKSKDRCIAGGSSLRTSLAVPHSSTNRALCRFTSEVERDPVHSTRYGRQRIC